MRRVTLCTWHTKCLVAVLLMLTPAVSWGGTQWLIYPVNISRVYDGDTLYINLPGLPAVFGEDLGIRLSGVDTPELRSRCKPEAAKSRERLYGQYVRDKLSEKIMEAQSIRIFNVSRGSFFRVVADVEVDGVLINQWLLDNHYAYATINGKTNADYLCDSANY